MVESFPAHILFHERLFVCTIFEIGMELLTIDLAAATNICFLDDFVNHYVCVSTI